MRTDAAVNGGNSGGGLFNDSGEVIGIVNAKLTDTDIDNIGYAIPSNVARYVADNIIYYDSLDEKNDAVYRLILGINVTVSEAKAELDTETGKVNRIETVIVGSVVNGGIADGKLFAEDVIKSVTIDGVTHDIVRTYNVVDVMLGARVGSSVVFTVVRGGEQLDVIMDTANAQLTQY
jgi:serine protease Do